MRTTTPVERGAVVLGRLLFGSFVLLVCCVLVGGRRRARVIRRRRIARRARVGLRGRRTWAEERGSDADAGQERAGNNRSGNRLLHRDLSRSGVEEMERRVASCVLAQSGRRGGLEIG